MSEDAREPSNADIVVALQGMWRQQNDLIEGVERRLTGKMDAVKAELRSELTETERRLGERIQAIEDRPVVVHIDMSRVRLLEEKFEKLDRRLAELEAARNH